MDASEVLAGAEDRVIDEAVAALESLRARRMRAIVVRAAAGMDVWSAGHDIGELPPGKRDPLGYNDPLEELIRAVRTFPAPVVAMVHGTVLGGALDLVLSCDLAIAGRSSAAPSTQPGRGQQHSRRRQRGRRSVAARRWAQPVHDALLPGPLVPASRQLRE